MRLPHRHADGDVTAEGFDVLAEGLVELDLAGRVGRFAERCAFGRNGEAFAVQVVAGRHGEVDFDGTLVQGARREAERLLRLEEVVGGTGTEGRRQQQAEQPQRANDPVGQGGGEACHRRYRLPVCTKVPCRVFARQRKKRRRVRTSAR